MGRPSKDLVSYSELGRSSPSPLSAPARGLSLRHAVVYFSADRVHSSPSRHGLDSLDQDGWVCFDGIADSGKALAYVMLQGSGLHTS